MRSPAPDEPVGLIIAGGRARRLGGGDKTLRRLADRPILAWLIDRLAPQCAALALNANGPAERFAAFGLPVVPDDPCDNDCGPLAGLLAGLDWAASHHPDRAALLTIPGDCPWPPTDLATRLGLGRDAGRAAVAAARSEGRTHPLAALWPVSIRDDLRRALRQDGERRVARFLSRFCVSWVDWPVTSFDPFTNVNTPDDLAAAARWIATACR